MDTSFLHADMSKDPSFLHADMSLHWVLSHFVGFVMSRLISVNNTEQIPWKFLSTKLATVNKIDINAFDRYMYVNLYLDLINDFCTE